MFTINRSITVIDFRAAKALKARNKHKDAKVEPNYFDKSHGCTTSFGHLQ